MTSSPPSESPTAISDGGHGSGAPNVYRSPYNGSLANKSTDNSVPESSLQAFDKLDKSTREDKFNNFLKAYTIFKTMKSSCPRLDMSIFQLRPPDDRLDENERARAESKAEYLLNKWDYTCIEKSEPKGVPEKSWYDDSLHWMPEKSEWKFCDWQRQAIFDPRVTPDQIQGTAKPASPIYTVFFSLGPTAKPLALEMGASKCTPLHNVISTLPPQLLIN
ncbi:hypothetical protein BDV59DRAFT_150792 [Aspergillus ambiguus]|uniref:uncharacterized protein n=1 Tax=Aspergillus ambiguus TaxID=176160 RepID=UPI003CCD0EF9